MENNTHDFAKENELTVTITLAEYRYLISEVSKSEGANIARWTAEDKLEKAEDRIAELVQIISKLNDIALTHKLVREDE